MSTELTPQTVKCFLCNQNIPKQSAQNHSWVCPALKKEEKKIESVEEQDSDDDSELIEDSDIIDDDESKTMSKDDAQLWEFFEKKKKEFNIGSLLSAKAVAHMKKG